MTFANASEGLRSKSLAEHSPELFPTQANAETKRLDPFRLLSNQRGYGRCRYPGEPLDFGGGGLQARLIFRVNSYSPAEALERVAELNEVGIRHALIVSQWKPQP